MSAAGLTILKDKICLISDGMATKNGKVHSKDSRKVYKINDTGLLWMGFGKDGLIEQLKITANEKDLTTPKEMVELAAGLLKYVYTNGYLDINNHRYFLLFVGYNANGEREILQLDNTLNKQFKPVDVPLKTGSVVSIANELGTNDPIFEETILESYRMVGVKQAMHWGLDALVMKSTDSGGQCGGQIFYEVISKP